MKKKEILHIIPNMSDFGGTPNKIKLLVKLFIINSYTKLMGLSIHASNDVLNSVFC